MSGDIRFARSHAAESLDFDIRHCYVRRLTAWAMIRSLVSGLAADCHALSGLYDQIHRITFIKNISM